MERVLWRIRVFLRRLRVPALPSTPAAFLPLLIFNPHSSPPFLFLYNIHGHPCPIVATDKCTNPLRLTFLPSPSPNYPRCPIAETPRAEARSGAPSLRCPSVGGQPEHDLQVVLPADHCLVVQPRQEPPLQKTDLLAAHAQGSGVVLDEPLDGLVEEDLVGHQGGNAQQPADLSDQRSEFTPHQEFQEQSQGQSRQEGRGTVQELLDQLLAQFQLGKLDVLQGYPALGGKDVTAPIALLEHDNGDLFVGIARGRGGGVRVEFFRAVHFQEDGLFLDGLGGVVGFLEGERTATEVVLPTVDQFYRNVLPLLSETHAGPSPGALHVPPDLLTLSELV